MLQTDDAESVTNLCVKYSEVTSEGSYASNSSSMKMKSALRKTRTLRLLANGGVQDKQRLAESFANVLCGE